MMMQLGSRTTGSFQCARPQVAQPRCATQQQHSDAEARAVALAAALEVRVVEAAEAVRLLG
jgi:hypothetical protein